MPVLPGFKDRTTDKYIAGAWGSFRTEPSTNTIRHLQRAYDESVRAWRSITAKHQSAMGNKLRSHAQNLVASAMYAKGTMHEAQKLSRQAESIASERLAVLEQALRDKLEPPTHAGAAGIQSEIRVWLRSLSGEKRIKSVTSAIQEGNEPLLQAIVSAPAELSELNLETHRRAREAWLQRRAPDEVAEYNDTRQALNLAKRAEAELVQHVGSLVDIEAAEAYQRTAEAAEVVPISKAGDAA